MTDSTRGFSLVREFDATPAELFRAWTDPDEAAAWWHPVGLTTPRDTVDIDLRVGGRYRYTMIVDATGDRFPTGGTYLEIVPDQKLVFTWGHPDDDPATAPVITVTFEPRGEATRMVFELRGLHGVAGDDSFYDGWVSALDEFARHVGGSLGEASTP